MGQSSSEKPQYDEWVQQSVQGNRRSLERLLLQEYVTLLQIVQNHFPSDLRNKIDAADVLQQALTTVFLKISTLAIPTYAAFLAWFGVIVQREVLDEIRYAQRQKRDQRRETPLRQDDRDGSSRRLIEMIAADESTVSNRLMREEEIQALRVGLAQLTPEYRRALELHYVQGLCVDDVSLALQKTLGATRGILDRAREQLRQVMQNATGRTLR